MDIEAKVKTALLIRGFDNDKILNNRGLIGATIDETILAVVKNLGIANVRERLISALDKVCEKKGNRFGEDIFIGHLGGNFDYELSQIDTDELIDALIEEYENAL